MGEGRDVISEDEIQQAKRREVRMSSDTIRKEGTI